MRRTVLFTKDFATKKKGDEFTCDGQLASQLVNVDKVAEYKKEGKASAKPKEGKEEPKED